MNRKGIILAGGTGSRLYPITKGVNKHLLPIYNKPMIYYSLSTLMLAKINEILIIINKDDFPAFHKLLGDGSQWGINLEYAYQDKPNGIGEAFIIAEKFLGNNNCALSLGDNLIYGNELINILCNVNEHGASIFGYPVKDSSNYGVIEIDDNEKIISIEEKPMCPKSNLAVPGLYFYDNNVIDIAKSLKPSDRGEIEITDINKRYLDMSMLHVEILGRGIAWLDTGTAEDLLKASSFVSVIEDRQGLSVCNPDEICNII